MGEYSGTFFVTTEVRFGRVSLVGRVHMLFPSNAGLSATGLFGVGADFRYTFGG